MESNKRIFRHSFGKLVLMSLGVLFLGYAAFAIGKTDYFLMTLAGIAFMIVLLYATSSVRISDEEITTSRLLGSKSLRWSEIAHVSVRGQALRLHDHDGDLILSIDSQLDGYKEILDIVFSKRPDLFEEGENTVMSSGWLGNLLAVGFGLLIVAVSVLLFSVSEEFEKIYSVIFFAVGVYFIVYWFLSPKSIALEDRTLLVMYFFREVSYPAEEIRFISLEKRKTKNGYVYFVQINLESGKKIELPGFTQGAALTYQILKRWHEKATSKDIAISRSAESS